MFHFKISLKVMTYIPYDILVLFESRVNHNKPSLDVCTQFEMGQNVNPHISLATAHSWIDVVELDRTAIFGL